MRRLSEMVVLSEEDSEWLVSEAMEPLQKAHDNAEQNEICVKELLMKSGVDSDTATTIEGVCREHEKKHLDEFQDAIDLVMCFLCPLLNGVPLPIEEISKLKELLSEKQIELFEANTGIKLR